MSFKPTYCLTIGDPSGIGPEITARVLSDEALLRRFHFIVIGHLPNLDETAKKLNLPFERRLSLAEYINIQGDPVKEAGIISYMALGKAVELVRSGRAQAIITGPVAKENLHACGMDYSGQTEMLQHFAKQAYKKTAQADMLFVHQDFRMMLLTRHVPLRSVSATLDADHIFNALGNLVNYLKQREGISRPKLCMLGLNPHAGEIGGEEESQILWPTLKRASEVFDFPLTPLQPADALFRGFDAQNIPYDAYIAPYHDQGLIPFKMVAGLHGVNVTIGLPFLRTSVSHGTAPDIVGLGVADPTSLLASIHLTERLLKTPSPKPQGLTVSLIGE